MSTANKRTLHNPKSYQTIDNKQQEYLFLQVPKGGIMNHQISQRLSVKSIKSAYSPNSSSSITEGHKLKQNDYLQIINDMKDQNKKLVNQRTSLFRKNCQLQNQIKKLKSIEKLSEVKSDKYLQHYFSPCQSIKSTNKQSQSNPNSPNLLNNNPNKITSSLLLHSNQSVDFRSPFLSAINTTKQSENYFDLELKNIKLRYQGSNELNKTTTHDSKYNNLNHHQTMRVQNNEDIHSNQYTKVKGKQILKYLNYPQIQQQEQNNNSQMNQVRKKQNIKIQNLNKQINKYQSLINLQKKIDLDHYQNKKKQQQRKDTTINYLNTFKKNFDCGTTPTDYNNQTINPSNFTKSFFDDEIKNIAKVRIKDLNQKINKVRGQNKQLKKQIFH